MPIRKKQKTTSLAVKMAELAFAVPQVVAHRMTRMAIAGPILSPRDKKEFTLMCAEKKEAFSQSWSAMTMQAFRANQAFAASIFRSLSSADAVTSRLQGVALDVLGKGLHPVHRKAVANAKRLARTKLR
jgi:hypothetical protein